MKKIGIITFHRAHNYGAILQAYALQKILEKNDVDAWIIDYYNHNVYDQYKIFKPLCKNLLKCIKRIIFNIIDYRKNKNRYNSFDNFINKNLKMTNRISNYQDLNKMNFNTVIVGSDQIWNLNITSGADKFYFLDDKSKFRKIAYAASVGDSKNITDNKKIFKTKLSKFDKISVREKDTENKIKELLNVDITTVLDPTLLVKKEEWLKKINKNRIIKEKYVFAYSVGKGSKEYYKYINDLSKKTGYKIVHFEKNRKFNKFKCNNDSYYTSNPFEFLNLLYNSEFVISSSFHCLVFSIIFNKNFAISLSNKPERLLNLLNLFGLTNRIINNENSNIINVKTDWLEVNKKLNIERDKSMKWLYNSI